MKTTYTAFAGMKLLKTGSLRDVALAANDYISRDGSNGILVFDDVGGAQIDMPLSGSLDDLNQWIDSLAKSPSQKSGPGRPKLGVVSKEIGLLPHHWDWLALQPRGASATLRRLVEAAKKQGQATGTSAETQKRIHNFMSAIAGNLVNYEEVLRALYGSDLTSISELIQAWPDDVRNYLLKLI